MLKKFEYGQVLGEIKELLLIVLGVIMAWQVFLKNILYLKITLHSIYVWNDMFSEICVQRAQEIF